MRAVGVLSVVALMLLVSSSASGRDLFMDGMDMGGMDMGSTNTSSMGSDSCSPYSMATMAMKSLCSGSASASPGCSVYNLCMDETVTPPIAVQKCDHTWLLNSVCLNDRTSTECQTYLTSLGSMDSCWLNNHLSIYNTSMTVMKVNAICTSMSMTGCSDCTMTSCPKPLNVYSSLCMMMPGMSDCSMWSDFCRAEKPGNMAVLCQKSSERPPACVTDPTDASCASYTYPDDLVVKDTLNLCTAMPDMPGCNLYASCSRNEVTNAQYCKPFAVLSTLCADMPSMSGCYSYVQMCNTTGSLISQCGNDPAVPAFPGYNSARTSMFSACGTHYMSACLTCTVTNCPNPLRSLATMCMEMGGMNECYGYQSWCKATGGAFNTYCAPTEYDNPPMTMYFHQRYQEFVLWKEWVPRTMAGYVGTIFAVIGFGFFSTLLKQCRNMMACKMMDSMVARPGSMQASSFWFIPSGHQFSENFLKALLTGVSLTMDYFNMLVAMTFNIGLFVAVIGGYILGAIFFGHLAENYAMHVALFPLNTGDGASNSSGEDVKVRNIKAALPLMDDECPCHAP